MKPRGLGQCSRCEKSRDGDDRYCKPCRAAYMRNWRREQSELFRKLKRIIKNVSRQTFDEPRAEGAGSVQAATKG